MYAGAHVQFPCIVRYKATLERGYLDGQISQNLIRSIVVVGAKQGRYVASGVCEDPVADTRKC